MGRRSQTPTHIDPWLWVYAIAGFILVVVKPSESIGWCLLNVCLWCCMSILMTIPHELGHALAARMMGINVIKIAIGSGRTWFQGQFLGLRWEFNQVPIGGFTFLAQRSTHFYRSRLFITVLFGPLTHVLLILLALQFPQSSFLLNLPGTYLFPGILFYVVNVTALVGNLLPRQTQMSGSEFGSDGLQMLTIPFLPKCEIRRRVALGWVVAAGEWVQRGNHEQAIHDLHRAIQTDSTCIHAYQGLGSVYLTLREFQSAVESLTQWIEVEPNSALPYLYRGIAYYHWRTIDATKLHETIKDLNHAIALQPNLEQSYYIRAACYSYIGNEPQAIEDFTKVIELNPTATAYYNRGVTYFLMQHFEAALADFEQVIQIDRQHCSAHYGRGNTKFALQYQAGAMQDYKSATALSQTQAIDANDEHGFYSRGLAFLNVGNLVRAMTDFQTAETLCLNHANTALLQKVREEIQNCSDSC